MGRIPRWRGGGANRLSHATGGWYSRLYTSRSFIREIRAIRGQKICRSSGLFFQFAVQRKMTSLSSSLLSLRPLRYF
jgi:hypothetical protein